MASTSKAFKIVCGSVSSLFDTRWHTQSLRLLFGQGARMRCPWGENLLTLWAFSMKKLRSHLSLFSRKEGQPSASRDSGTNAAKARRRIKSWGSQLDMADELERDRPFSRASAENESELLDCDDAIFLTSSDSAASALLGYAQEEQEMFEGEEVETEPSQSSCTAYDELLEVMDHKIISLKTPSLPSKPWILLKWQGICSSRSDHCFVAH